MRNGTVWTDEEIAVLCASQHLMAWEIAELLPRRTDKAITFKRSQLNVPFLGDDKRRRVDRRVKQRPLDPVDFGRGFAAQNVRVRRGEPVRITAPNGQLRKEAAC